MAKLEYEKRIEGSKGRFAATLLRKYPAYPDAEPRFYIVAYEAPLRTHQEAEQFLDDEIAKGRLYMANASGPIYAKKED